MSIIVRTAFLCGCLIVATKVLFPSSTVDRDDLRHSVGSPPAVWEANMSAIATTAAIGGTPLHTSGRAGSGKVERASSTPSGAEPIDPGRIVYVIGSRVNVRTVPSLQGRVIGQLPMGAKAELLLEENGWSRIDTSLGLGWMASRFLSGEAPTPSPQPAPGKRGIAAPTQKEIQKARKEIVAQSIASYAGSCPCPYNRDRAGRRCGGRSAWSRPGGYSPICYDGDVTEARLQTYFARQRGAAN